MYPRCWSPASHPAPDLPRVPHPTTVNPQLLQQDGVHVVLGASPVFAGPESVAVQRAGRLNLHCCTAAAELFSRDQSNVFGVAVDNAVYTQELYSQVCDDAVARTR